MMTRTFWTGFSPIPLSFVVAERRFSVVKSIWASAFIDALWDSGSGVVGASSHLSDEFDLPANTNVGFLFEKLFSVIKLSSFISHINPP